MLVATDQALADELAAAAGIHMGKDSGTPAVVASGVADPVRRPAGRGRCCATPSMTSSALSRAPPGAARA